MRARVLLTAVSLTLAWGTVQAQEARPQPSVGPPFAEVEATWNGFWTHVVEGDLAAAGRFIHSSRRHLLSGDKTLSNLQDLARQMAFCRLDGSSLFAAQNEVAYQVQCKRGNETAESLIILRRDIDGVWRLITF